MPRMRRSEFLKQAGLRLSLSEPSALVAADLAEEAGATWEPEQVELPERLKVVARSGNVEPGWYIVGLGCHCTIHMGGDRTLAEVFVARWNGLHELRRGLLQLRERYKWPGSSSGLLVSMGDLERLLDAADGAEGGG